MSPGEGEADARLRERCLRSLRRVMRQQERRREDFVSRRLVRVDQRVTDDPFESWVRTLRSDEGEVPQELGDDRLAQMSWAVVLGSAGAGKSVIVRELFMRAARAFEDASSAPFPVFVDLASVGPGGLAQETDGLYRGVVEAARRQGVRVALFLDGVDEGARRRPDLLRAVSGLVGELQPARVLVGCRTAQWSDEWTDAVAPDAWEPTDATPVYSVDHLEPAVYDTLLGDRLTRQAFFDACNAVGVSDLLRTPFDGFWLARRYARGEGLPASRQACLWEQVRERLERPSTEVVSLGRLETLAGHLAVVATFGPQQAWTVRDAVDLLGASDISRQEIHATGSEVEALLGTALFRAVGEGTYAFAHQLYREHLTAERLSGTNDDVWHSLLTIRVGGRDRVVPQHRALAAMLAERAPKWWEVLVEMDPRVLLFAESRGDRSSGAASLIRSVVRETTERGLPAWRDVRPTGEKLWWLVARHRPAHPADLVIELLGGEDPLERLWGAACALAWDGVPSADADLLRVALDDAERTGTRQFAIGALVKGGKAASLRPLRPLLDSPEDLVRGEAIRSYIAEGASALDILDAFDGGPRGSVHGSLQRAAREFGLGLGEADLRHVLERFGEKPSRFGKLQFWLLDGFVQRSRELGAKGLPPAMVSHIASGRTYRGDLDHDLADWMREVPPFWTDVFEWAVARICEGESVAYELPKLLAEGWRDVHAPEVLAAWTGGGRDLQGFLSRLTTGIWFANRSLERLLELKQLLGPVAERLRMPEPEAPDHPLEDFDADAVWLAASSADYAKGGVRAVQALFEAAVAVRDAARLVNGDPFVTDGEWLVGGAERLSASELMGILGGAEPSTKRSVLSALLRIVAASRFVSRRTGPSSWRLTDERLERALFVLVEAGEVIPAAVLAAAGRAHAFGRSAANLSYAPVLDALCDTEPEVWRDTLNDLLDDPDVETGRVLRYLRDSESPLAAARIADQLRTGTVPMGELDEAVAYMATVRPTGWQETLLDAHRGLAAREEELSSPRAVDRAVAAVAPYGEG